MLTSTVLTCPPSLTISLTTDMSGFSFLHGLDGEHKSVENACKYCKADVNFKSVDKGVFSATIKHDDDCPLWMLIQAQDGRV